MKQLFYILLFVVLSFTLCSLKEINPEKYPPEEELFYTMYVYPHYVFFDNEEMSPPAEVTLSPNHKAYVYEKDSIDTLGLWVTKGDTLLIYQNWGRYTWFDEEEAKKHVNSIYDIRSAYIQLHTRKNSDLSFPRNVSPFRISNHGDSLFALNDEFNHIGIPISSKAVHDRHYYYKGFGTMPAVPTNWLDTLHWHAISNPNCVKYSITNIDTTIITVSKAGIAFNILNPRFYQQKEALPYARRNEYCKWFDGIEIGDTISLELIRPAYDQAVFDMSPYLKGYPDSIYVLDNEVYGYWFAKPIYKNQ